MELIEHLESFLGTMTGGSRGDETTPEGVQVAFFGPDAPFPGVTTLVTVGLSRRHLATPDGGAVHQELLMHVPTDNDYPAKAAGVLFHVAGEMTRRGAALPPGHVIGPSGPLFQATRTTAVVAISPRYLPEPFAVCRTTEVPIILTWLIPLTTPEAELVRNSGWPALEQAIATQDPDLTNPARPSLAL